MLLSNKEGYDSMDQNSEEKIVRTALSNSTMHGKARNLIKYLSGEGKIDLWTDETKPVLLLDRLDFLMSKSVEELNFLPE